LPTTRLIILGTLPGVALGFYVRTRLLPDPGRFQIFVGAVLVYLAWRLLRDLRPTGPELHATCAEPSMLPGSWQRVVLPLGNAVYGFSMPALLAPVFVVGIIGGGAIIAPFCVAVLGLPVPLVAGAALAGTFATSVVGVLVYSLLPLPDGGVAAPDWVLGSLFGLGGLPGMYLGAAMQKIRSTACAARRTRHRAGGSGRRLSLSARVRRLVGV
jgi:hypothetical protein